MVSFVVFNILKEQIESKSQLGGKKDPPGEVVFNILKEQIESKSQLASSMESK